MVFRCNKINLVLTISCVDALFAAMSGHAVTCQFLQIKAFITPWVQIKAWVFLGCGGIWTGGLTTDNKAETSTWAWRDVSASLQMSEHGVRCRCKDAPGHTKTFLLFTHVHNKTLANSSVMWYLWWTDELYWLWEGPYDLFLSFRLELRKQVISLLCSKLSKCCFSFVFKQNVMSPCCSTGPSPAPRVLSLWSGNNLLRRSSRQSSHPEVIYININNQNRTASIKKVDGRSVCEAHRKSWWFCTF